MSIYINEAWIQRDLEDLKGVHCGETRVYETRFDSRGELFKSLQKEHGKCVSKLYHDDHGAIGWVFEKKSHYEDTREEFLLETWVTLHTAEPTKTIKYHYLKWK